MKLVIVLMAAMLSSLSVASYGHQKVTFLTHGAEAASYYDQQGKLRGVEGKGLRSFVVEVVNAMMAQRAQLNPVNQVPFARGLMMIETEADYALFNISRNADREHKFKWVGPTHGSEVYLYQRKNDDLRVRNLNEAKWLKWIAVQRGGEDHTFLAEQGFKNIYPVNTQAQALQMLLLGRIDMVPIGTNVLSSLAKESHTDLQSITRSNVKLFDTSGYIAFSKNVSDDEINQWQHALEIIKTNGTYQQLVDKYYRVMVVE